MRCTGLQLFRDGSLLGTALVPNLTLAIGSNNVTGTSVFRVGAISSKGDNAEPLSRQMRVRPASKHSMTLLERKVSHSFSCPYARLTCPDTPLRIAGYDGSTQIASLAAALGSLEMDVELPGLTLDLLASASLYGLYLLPPVPFAND